MTGWTAEYIRELEWPDVRNLVAYWDDNPPPNITLAAIATALGMKRKTDLAVNDKRLEDINVAGIVITKNKKNKTAAPVQKQPVLPENLRRK